jgi:hypothetical protein
LDLPLHLTAGGRGGSVESDAVVTTFARGGLSFREGQVKAGDQEVIVKLDARTVEQRKGLVTYGDRRVGECPWTKPDGPCKLRGRLLLGGKPPVGWICEIGSAAMDYGGILVRTNGRFELRAPYRGEWGLDLYPMRCPKGVRIGISTELKLADGENEWSLDVPVGEVQIENLKPLPTPEELNKLPKIDHETDQETTRTLYLLAWSGDGATGYAEKFAGPETVWRVSQVPVDDLEVILATRAAGGRPLGHHTLLRFTLKAGETKVVRLP